MFLLLSYKCLNIGTGTGNMNFASIVAGNIYYCTLL